MPVIRPARRDETHAALALILQQDRRPAPMERVLDFLQLALDRGIDLSQIWVTGHSGTILAAALPVIQPGRTVTVMIPPHSPDQTRQAALGELVTQITPKYASPQVQLAQVLFDPRDQILRDELCRGGYVDLAELLYLAGRTPSRISPPALPAEMTWRHYDEKSHCLFAEAISSTYDGTADCPALNGMRDIEDVIAGHQAAGPFDPHCWLLLMEQQRPLAALLMAGPRNDVMELTYLGVVPAARGRGISSLLMQQAFALACERSAHHLTLTVDSGNQPALRVYYRHGLRQTLSRRVMISDLRPRAGGTSVQTSRQVVCRP